MDRLPRPAAFWFGGQACLRALRALARLLLLLLLLLLLFAVAAVVAVVCCCLLLFAVVAVVASGIDKSLPAAMAPRN